MVLGRQTVQNKLIGKTLRGRLLAVLAALFFLFLSVVQAYAEGGAPVPLIRDVRFRQLASDLLIIEVSGTLLGLPTFHSGDQAGSLRWENTSSSKLKNSDRYSFTPNLPLASRVTLRKTEDKGIVMDIIGEKKLRLKQIKGMDGADSISIELQYMQPVQSSHAKRQALPQQNKIELDDRPITLELRDALPYEAFQILAMYAGMNLVADTSLPSKKISISFKDAPFQQVFSFLLRSYDLTYGVVGNTLVIGTEAHVGKVLGLHVTKAYSIAYADAEKVPKLLHMLARLPEMPVVDERTRQIYVTCSEAQHYEVEDLIERIDHPGRQVMLEARLIEVDKDAKAELETLITAVYKGWIFSSGASGGSAEYTYANADHLLGEGLRAPGTELNAIHVIDPALKLLDAGLRAMESKKQGKILASPSVMALDGEKAVIKLTRNYLYQSSVDDKSNANFTEQETGPTLEITPFIGRDGYITMDMNIATGEIIGFHKSGISEAPEMTKRQLETRIRVRDGELFVIGGLYQETQSKNVMRVPVLGYVPLLGELFTSRQTKNVKSEMAFIVIPHIMDIPFSGPEIHDIGRKGRYREGTELW